jgi:hypothetical protein
MKKEFEGLGVPDLRELNGILRTMKIFGRC